MTFFTQAGDAFMPTAGRESLLEELPAGNYIVVQPMMGPMYFQRVSAFPKAPRLYGDVEKRAGRIMQTFLDRPRSTGVLLEGEKGSGKSQLARVISELGYDSGIPTILVNAPFHGDGFNNLLSSIEQPAIILIDEFEKVYRDQEHQEAILTLLDGVMTSQKLFIFTVNDKYKVNSHMKNRPGRLFYSIDFKGLDPSFIREYCDENLEIKENIDGVLTLSAMFRAFNFDMLKALVEEMNRYDESAFEAIELLNAKPFNTTDYNDKYDVVVVTSTGMQSEPVEVDTLPVGSDGRNSDHVGFYVKFPGTPDFASMEKPDEPLAEWERKLLGVVDPTNPRVDTDGDVYVVVEAKTLRKVDVDAGRYRFVSQNGLTIDFTRKPRPAANHHPMAW